MIITGISDDDIATRHERDIIVSLRLHMPAWLAKKKSLKYRDAQASLIQST